MRVELNEMRVNMSLSLSVSLRLVSPLVSPLPLVQVCHAWRHIHRLGPGNLRDSAVRVAHSGERRLAARATAPHRLAHTHGVTLTVSP